MNSLVSTVGIAAATAGLGLALVPDASAQVRPGDRQIQRPHVERPALQKASLGSCAFDIRLEGRPLARGIILLDGHGEAVGPESLPGGAGRLEVTPDFGERRGPEESPRGAGTDRIDGIDGEAITRVDGIRDPDRLPDCTSAQLDNASPKLAWVRVEDVADATGNSAAFQVERGTLRTTRATTPARPAVAPRPAARPTAGGRLEHEDISPGRLAVQRPTTLSRQVVSIASTEEEEEIQMMPVSDLMRALGIEPGDDFIEPGDDFIGPQRGFLDLKTGPGCTLCAFDAF